MSEFEGYVALVAAVAKTGLLRLHGFSAAALGVASEHCPDRAERIFNALDRNGDRLLTAPELTFGGSYGDGAITGGGNVEAGVHDSDSDQDPDEWNAAVAELARLAFLWRWRQTQPHTTK